MYVGGQFTRRCSTRDGARRTPAAGWPPSTSTAERSRRSSCRAWTVPSGRSAAVGPSLYVGGTFTHVDGVARRGVAKLDAATGRLDPTFSAASVRGDVTDLDVVDGRLIIGGSFAKRLAALDLVTGADTGYLDLHVAGRAGESTSPSAVYRFAVAAGRLVAIGNVGTVAGQPRQRAFMVDLGTTKGTLDPWYYPHFANAAASRPSCRRTCATSTSPPTAAGSCSWRPAGSRSRARAG